MNPDTLIQRGNAGYSKQQKQLRQASSAPAQTSVQLQTSAPLNAPKEMPAGPSTGLDPTKYNAGGGVVNPYGTAPAVSPTAPISSATMTPVSPVTLPTPIQPTAAAGMSGAIEATNKSIAQQRAEALTAQQENEVASRGNLNNQLLQEIMGVNTEMTNASTTIDRTEQNKLREESDSLTRQIEMEQESTRQKVNALRESNPQGLFGGALQDEMDRLQRDSGNRLATLAIQRSAALRDFATADSIANEQLRLKLEPLKLKAENLKLFYEDNKDRFNKADDRLFAEVTRKAEQEYKKAESIETQLTEMKKNVAQYAGSKANSILSQLAQIDTSKPGAVDKAFAIAGEYQTDPLEKAIKKAQLNRINQDISQSRTAFNLKTQAEVSGTSPEQQQIETRRLDVQDKIAEIKRLKNHSGLGVVVGPNALFSRGGSIKSMTGETADFVGSVKQLTDQATLDTLLALKAAGGTLGAIAIKELEILQNSATKINNWEKKDKNGNGLGVWSIDEKSFKNELSRLETSYQRVIDALPGNATDSYFEASAQALVESNSPFLKP